MNFRLNRKNVSLFGICIALILLCCGMFMQVPSREISVYGDDSYVEYVGGDAYNIQIEASLLAGEIAGAVAQRAIFISMAALLFLLSLYGLSSENEVIKSVNTEKIKPRGNEEIINNNSLMKDEVESSEDSNVNKDTSIDDK